MKTNQNDARSFIIERTDKFTESSDLFSLYDLSHVNSKLSAEEREQLLYSVKKNFHGFHQQIKFQKAIEKFVEWLFFLEKSCPIKIPRRRRL